MYATEADLEKRFGKRQLDELKTMHIEYMDDGETPKPIRCGECGIARCYRGN